MTLNMPVNTVSLIIFKSNVDGTATDHLWTGAPCKILYSPLRLMTRKSRQENSNPLEKSHTNTQ